MSTKFLDDLIREHARMGSVLDLMQQQVTAIESGGAPNMEVFGFSLDYLRNFPTSVHHPKEDLMYYHMYSRAPGFKSGMTRMLAQHRRIHELETKLAGAVAMVGERGPIFYPRFVDCTRQYLSLQLEHRDIEERVLFPLANRLLDAQDWAYLSYPVDDLQEMLVSDADLDRFDDFYFYITGPLLRNAENDASYCGTSITRRPATVAYCDTESSAVPAVLSRAQETARGKIRKLRFS